MEERFDLSHTWIMPVKLTDLRDWVDRQIADSRVNVRLTIHSDDEGELESYNLFT